MSMKKAAIAVAIVGLVGVGIATNLWWRQPAVPEVNVEEVVVRDLEATVSGSGAIRPAREVDISSNVMGRVTRLAVEEGEEVAQEQFLLEVDPQRLRSQVDQMQASLEAARTQLQQTQETLEYLRGVLDRREGEWRQGLIPREGYEAALQDVEQAERTVEMRRADIVRLQAQLEQARYDLTQVIIDSPIHGIITRLNIDEGENVVTGTMNNPGTVLLTIADLSVIEAEIEVDETDVVHVAIGQPATVRVDAFPDHDYRAVVTEVGKSPIQAAASAGTQAINFKVVVRITEEVPGARPGLSCTADIVTATRERVPSVPIQALILREMQVEEGKIVRGWDGAGGADDDGDAVPEPVSPSVPADLYDPDDVDEDGNVELEGAFVLRDGRAVFMPIDIGIAGERHFEVLAGVEPGERIILGPFDVIRTLRDGDRVREREEDEEEELLPGRGQEA